MEWSELNFGRHAGKTLPHVAFAKVELTLVLELSDDGDGVMEQFAELERQYVDDDDS